MPTAQLIYQGMLRCQATHTQSQTTIVTDAPTDNQGQGNAFSPTDLLATALASCMTTIMGIAANTHDIDIDGTRVELTKVMAQNPRRVAEVQISFLFGKKSAFFTQKEKNILEHAAKTCPVALSLHPDLVQSLSFHYHQTA